MQSFGKAVQMLFVAGEEAQTDLKVRKKNSKIEQKSKKPTVLVNLPENIDLMYT